MKSKAITFVVTAVCAAVLLIGCGGGGGGGDSSGPANGGSTGNPNPFGGRWDGTFTQASPADNGTITLAIAANGAVSGDVFDANLSQEGILSGAMTIGGSMAFTVKFTSVTESWTGTATKDGGGHMVGTINVSGNGPTSSRTFDLAPF